MSGDYAIGFRSVEREYRSHPLDPDGAVPGWLEGSLIRNGPGRFEVGGDRVDHWFDGLAMLSQFSFEAGQVTYTNRFLRSDEYASVVGRDRLAGGQFGTGGRGLLVRLRDGLLPSVTDNANVNVVRIGDRFVAITETPIGIEFDPQTLETRGRYRFDDLAGQTMTAHPHVDPRTGELVTYSTVFGRTCRYEFSRLAPGATRFRRFGAVPTDRPAYVHSVGLTAEHVVLVEFPFDVSPLELLRPGPAAYVERFRWRPDAGTRFVVVDRASGDVAVEAQAAACFGFHHVNAFRDGDAVVADVTTFEDAGVIDALYLETLESTGLPTLDGSLTRFRVPLSGGSVESATLHGGGVTLPRISPDRHTRRHRYVYAQGTPDPAAGVGQRLLKVDTRTRGSRSWGEPATFCGEPVFVPRPGATREDDGVVLSVVLETEAQRSALLVLDGRTFEERARAPLPHVVPFDFHGRFFPDV